jgi:hypothetical protein
MIGQNWFPLNEGSGQRIPKLILPVLQWYLFPRTSRVIYFNMSMQMNTKFTGDDFDEDDVFDEDDATMVSPKVLLNPGRTGKEISSARSISKRSSAAMRLSHENVPSFPPTAPGRGGREGVCFVCFV